MSINAKAVLDAPPAIRRVLIVEDEDPLRMIIRRNLEHRGIAVSEARTAVEALASVAGEMPDLMLLDINLPDRTGWDVLRDLRASGMTPRTIVVSAVRVPTEKLREFAVEAYLPKPFPIEALVRICTDATRA